MLSVRSFCYKMRSSQLAPKISSNFWHPYHMSSKQASKFRNSYEYRAVTLNQYLLLPWRICRCLLLENSVRICFLPVNKALYFTAFWFLVSNCFCYFNSNVFKFYKYLFYFYYYLIKLHAVVVFILSISETCVVLTIWNL